MNNLLYFRKRQTQQQAHYDLSAKHRVDDFDHKSWWKSVAIFWACIILFMLVMATVKYATACGDLESEPVIIKVVNL